MPRATVDPVPAALLNAVRRGAKTGVTYSADAIIATLTDDYRWTSPMIAEFLRRVRAYKAPAA